MITHFIGWDVGIRISWAHLFIIGCQPQCPLFNFISENHVEKLNILCFYVLQNLMFIASVNSNINPIFVLKNNATSSRTKLPKLKEAFTSLKSSPTLIAGPFISERILTCIVG